MPGGMTFKSIYIAYEFKNIFSQHLSLLSGHTSQLIHNTGASKMNTVVPWGPTLGFTCSLELNIFKDIPLLLIFSA